MTTFSVWDPERHWRSPRTGQFIEMPGKGLLRLIDVLGEAGVVIAPGAEARAVSYIQRLDRALDTGDWGTVSTLAPEFYDETTGVYDAYLETTGTPVYPAASEAYGRLEQTVMDASDAADAVFLSGDDGLLDPDALLDDAPLDILPAARAEGEPFDWESTAEGGLFDDYRRLIGGDSYLKGGPEGSVLSPEEYLPLTDLVGEVITAIHTGDAASAAAVGPSVLMQLDMLIEGLPEDSEGTTALRKLADVLRGGVDGVLGMGDAGSGGIGGPLGNPYASTRDAFAERRKNWVAEVGGLPRYIRRIADHMISQGKGESHAIAAAVNTVKRWARGGGEVKPETVAKAAAALAEWEAKKAAAHAMAAETTTLAPATETFAAEEGVQPVSEALESVAASTLSVANAFRGRSKKATDLAVASLEESIAAVSDAMESRQSLVASMGSDAKLAAPVTPPRAWFVDPRLDGVTPLTVTPDGRVYGHLATWDVCHLDYGRKQCVTAPKSYSSYAAFHLGILTTAEGEDIPVGRLIVGTSHADGMQTMASAGVYYSDTGHAVADVRAGEDRYGIWVAGALRPDVTPTQLRVLKASPLSGDWREDPRSGRLELTAALAVNSPGFPVPRPLALVASTGTVSALTSISIVAPKKVARPGTSTALSFDDLAFLKERAAAGKAWTAAVNKAEREALVARAAKFSARRRTLASYASRIKEIR